MKENSVMVDLTQGTIECELLEEVKTGILHGWNKLRFPDGSEGYIHSKFCYRKAESSKEFLKAHWDTERNMLKVEFIDEYYQLFRDERKKAIKETLERLNHSEPIDTRREQDSAAQAKSASNNESKKKEHKYIQLSLFD